MGLTGSGASETSPVVCGTETGRFRQGMPKGGSPVDKSGGGCAAQPPEVFKKDASLIHLYAPDMNLVPRKLMSCLIFHAKDQHGPKFVCNVADVLEQIGYTSRDLHYFHEALKYLMSSRVEWNILDVKGRSLVGASTFISSYQIVNGRILEYAFSAHLLERIFNPEIFAVFDMAVIRSFNRVGGLALYETCKRFAAIGHTPWNRLEVWRKIFDATAPNYDTPWRLMDKIIRPAQDEVNQISDINVQFEVTREDRKIAQVRFLVSEKPQRELIIASQPDPASSEIYSILLNDFGISEPNAARYVTIYPEEYIRGNIAVVHEAVAGGKVKNVSGYLVRALEQDYRKKENFQDRQRRENAERAETAAKHKKRTEEVARAEREIRDTKVWQFVASMAPEVRGQLFDRLVREKPFMFRYSQAHRDNFAQRGVIENSPMIRGAMLDLVASLPEFGA